MIDGYFSCYPVKENEGENASYAELIRASSAKVKYFNFDTKKEKEKKKLDFPH